MDVSNLILKLNRQFWTEFEFNSNIFKRPKIVKKI